MHTFGIYRYCVAEDRHDVGSPDYQVVLLGLEQQTVLERYVAEPFKLFAVVQLFF